MPLFCSLMIVGCNNPSTSSAKLEKKPVPDKTSQAPDTVEVIERQESSDEGSSLMDLAESTASNKKTNSPMIAEKRADSTLQATLIGNYTGILPCASCEAIVVSLNLHSDGTVDKSSVYRNSEASQPTLLESGIYRQDDKVITVVYAQDAIETYQVQDNHLILLDANKVPKTDYTLARQ